MYAASILPLLSLILVAMGTQFFGTFLAIRLEEIGVSNLYIGFLNAGLYLGMLLGSLLAPFFIARLSHARSFAIATALCVASMLLMRLQPQLELWLFLRSLIGFSLGLIYVTVEGWLLYFAGESQRGRAFALYMVALYSSQSISQPLLQCFSLDESYPFIWSALICTMGMVPLLCEERLLYSRPQQESLHLGSVRSMIKLSPGGVFGCFCGGMILSSIYSFFPKFAMHNALTPSYLMGGVILAGMCFQWPFGALSDRFERKKVLMFTEMLTLLPLFALIYLDSPHLIYINSLFLGALVFTLYPQSTAAICEVMPSTAVTAACSVAAIAYGAGAIFGPLCSGLLISLFGLVSLPIYLAFMAFSGMLFHAFSLFYKSKERISVAEKAPSVLYLSSAD